jgi:hypothetical protein
MNNKTEFILSSDGKIIQREIVENEKILSASALDELSTGVVRHLSAAFELPEIGPVNCDINQECAHFTCRIPFLPLKTRYVIKDEILVPSFSSKRDPVFDLKWKAPQDMRLILVIEVHSGNTYLIGVCYLFAFDPDKRCYRLPLGNLYDDGKICMGDFRTNLGDCQKAVQAAWEQFKTSAWNGDLDSRKEWSQQLFRFKATKDGFDQLEPADKWTALADKISPPILNQIRL